MRATGVMRTCHNDGYGHHNNGKRQHGTCGTTTATGISMATARCSRATGGTMMATGDMTRWHDKGDARRTTTIRYFILVRLAED